MNESILMPKKTDTDRTHIVAGLNTLLGLKQSGESDRDVFKKVMKRNPKTQSELNAFSNRLQITRGNPGLDFLGKFAEAYPEIRDMTVGDLLGVKESQ